MTNLPLDEWERLAEAATEPPWEPCLGSGMYECTALSHQAQEGPGTEFVCDLLPDWALDLSPRKYENMEFIAASRTAVPALISTLRSVQETVREQNEIISAQAGKIIEMTQSSIQRNAEIERLREALLWISPCGQVSAEHSPTLEKIGEVARAALDPKLSNDKGEV